MTPRGRSSSRNLFMNKEVLTKTQQALLEHIGKKRVVSQNFYLTGGTALAAFYLEHRYSEDCDFFSEEEIDTLQLDIALKELQKEVSISKIDYQQSYNRNLFFLHFEDEVLKTEFTYFPFSRIEKGREQYGITVDSLIDIAVNKLFSIYQRSHARDYVDLYCIIKEQEWLIRDLVLKAKAKFDWHIDPLQLGTQFMKAREVKDYPRMVIEVNPEDWKAFFEKEAKNLKGEILE